MQDERGQKRKKGRFAGKQGPVSTMRGGPEGFLRRKGLPSNAISAIIEICANPTHFSLRVALTVSLPSAPSLGCKSCASSSPLIPREWWLARYRRSWGFRHPHCHTISRNCAKWAWSRCGGREPFSGTPPTRALCKKFSDFFMRSVVRGTAWYRPKRLCKFRSNRSNHER